MTKEELEKEAIQSAKKFFGKPTDLVDLDNLRIFKNGYLTAAEPREKWIAHLEAQIERNKIDFAISEHDREHDDYEFTEVYKKIEQLEKENTKLKCECRRCVYTDSPCVLSDYGKDGNGICDHFKDVFDENTELKEESDFYNKERGNYKALYLKEVLKNTKAKELLKMVLDWQYRCGNGHPTWQEVCAKIEQFLKEVKK